MADILGVFMRWLHLSSVALLVGGALYGSMALRATREAVAADSAEKLADAAAAVFRPRVLACIAALVISGIWRILTTPGHTTRYYIWLAIKLLLALHVFTSALLATRAGNPRRLRLMTSAGISGIVIILLSAYLGRIF